MDLHRFSSQSSGSGWLVFFSRATERAFLRAATEAALRRAATEAAFRRATTEAAFLCFLTEGTFLLSRLNNYRPAFACVIGAVVFESSRHTKRDLS